MNLILGLDPSIKKAGYCVLDTEAPYDAFVERGRLKTSSLDGILVQRLIKQRQQIRDLMDRFDIKFVSMEAPYLDDSESEHLFALNQFIHEVFLERGTFVICFPPQQLKKLACPGQKANEVHKPHMIAEAKKRYRLAGKLLTNDEADAMHAAHLGKLFYNWHFAEKLTDKDLNPDLLKAFAGKHTYSRGAKKGSTDYTGLIYRENELFFNFQKIKDRKASHGSSKKDSGEESSREKEE
jgi:Holliday junction resolvasome RuvABC endonuclease subunit